LEYKASERYNPLEIFSIILLTQFIYSSTAPVFRGNGYCNTSEQAWGWILLSVTTAIAFIVVVITFHFGSNSNGVQQESQENCKWYKKQCKKKCLLLLLTLPSVFLLLLSNNLQPLDCAFHCDFIPAINSSESQAKITPEPGCEVRNNAITRLSMIVVLILLLLAILSLIAWIAVDRKNKTSPTRDKETVKK